MSGGEFKVVKVRLFGSFSSHSFFVFRVSCGFIGVSVLFVVPKLCFLFFGGCSGYWVVGVELECVLTYCGVVRVGPIVLPGGRVWMNGDIVGGWMCWVTGWE